MLPRQAIMVGKYYTNKARKVVREIVSINEKTVGFITYHLDTGNSCGSASECPKAQFIRWADHEASPSEMAKIQYQRMEAMFRAPQTSSTEFQKNIINY